MDRHILETGNKAFVMEMEFGPTEKEIAIMVSGQEEKGKVMGYLSHKAMSIMATSFNLKKMDLEKKVLVMEIVMKEGSKKVFLKVKEVTFGQMVQNMKDNFNMD